MLLFTFIHNNIRTFNTQKIQEGQQKEQKENKKIKIITIGVQSSRKRTGILPSDIKTGPFFFFFSLFLLNFCHRKIQGVYITLKSKRDQQKKKVNK